MVKLQLSVSLTLERSRKRQPEPEPEQRDTTSDTLVERSGQPSYPFGFAPATVEDQR
jgi:hypothetical protein